MNKYRMLTVEEVSQLKEDFDWNDQQISEFDEWILNNTFAGSQAQFNDALKSVVKPFTELIKKLLRIN